MFRAFPLFAKNLVRLRLTQPINLVGLRVLKATQLKPRRQEMTEPKKTTYQVINEEGTVEYTTDNLDRAIGYAECMKEQMDTKVSISQVILV